MTTKRKATVEDILPLFGNNRLEGNTSSRQLSTITGTAVAGSDDGLVKVIIGDGAVTDGNSGSEVEIPTSVKVEAGDTVVITNNGNGTIGSPLVTDVIGGGDRAKADIDAATDAARLAKDDATQAKRVADEAKSSVEATNQHFFTDEHGIHVTTEADNWREGPNLLANSEGIMLRNGIFPVSAQTPSGFSVYLGYHTENLGNPVIATFGETTTIGLANSKHIHIDSTSFALLNDSEPAMKVGWIKVPRPNTSLIGMYDYIPTFMFGAQSSSTGKNSFADSGGSATDDNAHADSMGIANGIQSHADSMGSATGTWSHASAGGTAAGQWSSAFGEGVVSNTWSGLACGRYNEPSTNTLFAVGNGENEDARSNALEINQDGSASFGGNISAEYISASGDISANGKITGKNLVVSGHEVITDSRDITQVGTISASGNITSGGLTSAEARIGTGTQVANGKSQTAVGKYNTNNDDTLFVVGNGTSNTARSNAMRVTTAGNVGVSGNISAGGTILDTVKQGTGTLTSAGVSGSCKWVKSGHVVQVYVYAKLKNALSTYSALNNLFTGLPKAIITNEASPVKIDGSVGTCFSTVSASGGLGIIARETALAANAVVLGAFTYISSE